MACALAVLSGLRRRNLPARHGLYSCTIVVSTCLLQIHFYFALFKFECFIHSVQEVVEIQGKDGVYPEDFEDE